MKRLTGREKGLFVVLAIMAGVAGWKYTPRHWSPRVTLETEHYRILSSATEEQTREIGQVAEIVYAGYLHMRITKGWRGRRAAYFAIFGFAVVMFTFFGVTYLLPGLHAYA
jgi:hypothetical protein